MALEDCEILAMLLAHHQDRDAGGWRLATKLYSDMRIPRLLWIRQEADKRSGMKQDMGIVQEMVMYFFIWLGCKYALSRHRRLADERIAQARLGLLRNNTGSLVRTVCLRKSRKY